MNKAMVTKDFKVAVDDEFNKAAGIETDNYRVFLRALDIDRTLRIYSSLLKLSTKRLTQQVKGNMVTLVYSPIK